VRFFNPRENLFGCGLSALGFIKLNLLVAGHLLLGTCHLVALTSNKKPATSFKIHKTRPFVKAFLSKRVHKERRFGERGN
jgi:hypothetical protein